MISIQNIRKYFPILLAAGILILYANSLDNEFVSDDRSGILFYEKFGTIEMLTDSVSGFGKDLIYFILNAVF